MNAAAPIFSTICNTICQIRERSKISTSAQIFKTCAKALWLVLPLLCIGCEQTQEPEPAPPPVVQQPRPVLNRTRSRVAQQQAPEQNAATHTFLSAVQAGDLTAVQAALDAGADPNTRDAQGQPALQLATVKKHPHVVTALLKKGADTEAVETATHGPHFTPVQLAASNGDNATLQVLLDHGAHINAQNPHTQHTALLLAVQKNHIDTVKMLLERGADANIRGARGYTCLIEAATKGQTEIAQLLLEHGADPDLAEAHSSWTALMMAAVRADAKLVAVLINHGADLTITNPKGHTALDVAYQRDDSATIDAIEAQPRPPVSLASQSTAAEPTGPTGPTGLVNMNIQPTPGEQQSGQQHTDQAPTEPHEQITTLVALAQKQFQKKNLTTPKGDNALDTCLEILDLEPGQEDAVQLVRKIEAQYRNWAKTSQSAKRRQTYTEKAAELASIAR